MHPTITEPRLTYRDRHGRANPGKGAGFLRAQQRLSRQREIWANTPTAAGAEPRQSFRRRLRQIMGRA